jgi:TRAP-type C4-dicarboxylate transport system permease small subunit
VIDKESKVKDLLKKSVEFVLGAAWLVITLPFLAPAYVICRILGTDPMSMDSMGLGFFAMVLIAIGIAVGAGFFALGYFL